MKSTTHNNRSTHRSEAALSVTYSRADKRKYATAGPSSLCSPSFPLLPSQVPVLSSESSASRCESNNNASCPERSHQETHSSSQLFKPRSSVYLGAFNVRTLKQAGQQAALVRTLDSLAIDVCCVSETRIQDPSTYVNLSAPSVCSRYRLRTSGDPSSQAAGYAGVGIVLSSRAEASLVDWIPVNARLCAVRLTTSTATQRSLGNKRCLFVISAYAPTDPSSEAVKDAFYQELTSLLRKAKSSDIIVLAGDLNAQVGRLGESERQLGGTFGLDTERTDNGERLLQLCADQKLFLSSTAFRHKKRRVATWRPPNSEQPWTQIDHVAISDR